MSDNKTRNNNIKLNIFVSLILKVISVGLSFLIVPLTINYIDNAQYGIWLTLLSILNWITLGDIGLGNGLRNRLTEAFEKKDRKSAKEYISTAYASLSIIVFILFLILSFIIPLLNWQSIFNTAVLDNKKLITLNMTVLIFFMSNFILSLYNQLYYASQKASMTGLGQLLINIISIIGVVILRIFTKGDIIFLSLSYGFSLIIPSIIMTSLFFKKNKDIIPSFNAIKFRKVKDIMSLGIKFFVVQIAAVLFFSLSNLIITQISGPESVTIYNIVYKLFSSVVLFHTILLTPLWSAYTEAYIKKDMLWIKSTLKKLVFLNIPIIILLLLIILFSDFIFKIWIGNQILIDKKLVVLMAIYSFLIIWGNIYSYYLNGINKINIQMYISVITILIFIPLTFLLGKKLEWGINGIVLAQIITALPFAILGPIATLKSIKNDN